MSLTVAAVMTREVYAVAPDTSIETAARLLATRHISGAPVVNTAGCPVGVISVADLIDPDRPRTDSEGYPLFYRLTDGTPDEIGDGGSHADGQVSDVMSPFVLSVNAGCSLVDAARLMIAESVHRLLVMDGRRLVGIVSAIDLLRGFARGQG